MTEVRINDAEADETLPSFFFVTATRKKESEKEQLPLLRCLKRMNLPKGFIARVFVEFDNSHGLPMVYNGFIENQHGLLRDDDIVVFLHDDLWVNDVFFFDKIISSAKHYDVIGACGGKAWDSYGNGDTPIIWTHAARNKGMSGFMVHAADETQSKVKHEVTYEGRSIFATNYGYAPSRVLTIDGCLMCFTKKAIDEGLRFDESFKFHFYDMDMCFSAFVKGLKIGTAPVLVTHESLGYSVAQPQFIESQKIFMKKWFKK